MVCPTAAQCNAGHSQTNRRNGAIERRQASRHNGGMSEPPPSRRPSLFRGLLASETAGGFVLMASAAAALAVANSPAAPAYEAALHAEAFGLSLLHWVNDGLMVLFFLLVGLEIKRELIGGELSSWHARILPGLGAFGGMLVPALIYVAVNAGSPATLRGWAIPSATDIAFSLGVLALLGPRVPVSLKMFLTALAIIDDLGAILIIAAFYASGLSLPMLAGAAVVTLALVVLNRRRVTALWPYLLLGVALWLLVLKSGIHATVAGVILAAAVPMGDKTAGPLFRLEHGLQPWVAFLVLPVFGFANAGVPLAGLGLAGLTDPVTLGSMLGLYLGKPIGVFGAAALAVRLGLARLPPGASPIQVYGVAVLCGIGFTMSLFIGILAFADTPDAGNATKIGVFIGSLLSAATGWAVLRFCRPARGG